MEFKFYIEDRYGVKTPIVDPIGWDGLAIELSRDAELHGLFFDFQGDEFVYQGKAAELLRDEYDTYGIQGKKNLVINYICDSGGAELNLYTGKFLFGQWDDSYGDDCGVKLPVETTSDIMTFRNRIEQKVNLQTTVSFDDGTALPAYARLPFEQTLPGKRIFVQDYSANDSTFATIANQYPDASVIATIPNTAWQQISGSSFGYPQVAVLLPFFQNRNIAEIGSYDHPLGSGYITGDTGRQWNYPPGFTTPSDWVQLPYSPHSSAGATYDYVPLDEIEPIVNYDEDLAPVFGPLPFTGLTLDLDLRGHVGSVNLTSVISSLCFYCGIRKKNGDVNWLSLTATPVGSATTGWAVLRATNPSGGNTGSFSFNKQFTLTNLTLERGDRLYFFQRVGFTNDTPDGDVTAFFAGWYIDAHFNLSGLSSIQDTTSKMFMVNEALSRITETITNDRLRVYSKFYGRTDSQPYAVAADGCGALTAITPGLFVRRMEQKLTDRPPLFTVSFKDMMNGLVPIHNIGAGIEPDPFRAGYNCVRIEPWHYFYEDDVLMQCTGISQLKRKVRLGDHVAIFKFGYEKWEAEEYNGIDEFLTKREYRTELSECSNVFSQLSKFIGSPYAIEITRRKGNTSSEDWRYDNETFIIGMKRDGSDIVVNQGNINDPNHIIDPDSFYNFELRPAMMALRWLPRVLASYRSVFVNSRIIFTSGDGNYYAEGWDGGGLNADCFVGYDGPVSEKQDLSPLVMMNPDTGLPIWYPEDIVYEFPLSVAEWKLILANPKKLIYYETDGISGYGWINNVKYRPDAGSAEFTLRPKRI